MECEHKHTKTHVWWPEDNFQDLVLCFHHVSPKDWAQVVMFGSPFIQVSHFASPFFTKICEKNTILKWSTQEDHQRIVTATMCV